MTNKLINIDFRKINMKQVRDDVNLILFKSGLGNIETMKFTNKIVEVMTNVKIKIPIV